MKIVNCGKHYGYLGFGLIVIGHLWHANIGPFGVAGIGWKFRIGWACR